jgi:two-component system chemotaxis sensor kinase CheA
MTVSDEFVRESTAQLQALSDGLIAIERAPDDAEALDEAFRTAHSLKGNCAMAGLDGASAVAHVVEDVLGAVRAGEVRPAPTLVDAALDGTDAIEDRIEAAARDEAGAVDTEARVEALREALAERRAADEDADPVVPDASAEDDATPPEEVADAPDDLDADVLDALDTAAEYDDLDGLLAAMDDEGDLDGIPELPEAKGLGESASETEASADDATGATTPERSEATDGPSSDEPFATPAEESDDAATPDERPSGDDAFAAVRAEVAAEESDLDELEADIEATSFGEFDDDDDLSIAELVEGIDDGGFNFGEDRTDAGDDTDAPFGTPDDPDPAPDAGADTDTGFDGAGPFAADAPDTGDATAATDGFDGSGPFAAPEGSTDESSAASTEPSGDDAFAAVRAEVAAEESDLDELEADIEATSFGEFDDDDDLSIAELVEGDADPERSSDDTAVAAATDDATAAVVPDPSADATPAVTPADGTPSVPEAESAPSVPEHPTGTTPAVTPAADEPEGPAPDDDVPPVPEPAADARPAVTALATEYATMDWGDLQRHAADRSVYRPGMTRVAVEAALDALDAGASPDAAVEAALAEEGTDGPTDVDAAAVPEPSGDARPAVEPADGPPTAPEAPGDDGTAPPVPDHPDATPAVVPADGTPEVPPVRSDSSAVDDLAASVDDVSAEAADDGLDADVEDLLADADEGLATDDTAAVDVDDALEEPAAAADDLATPADDASAEATDDLDADVDDLLDGSFGADDADDAFEAADADVEFARDTATEAFESRFGDLFGAEEAVPTRTVTSLAESSAADLFADPADERAAVDRDRVQSITVDVDNAEALLSMVEELTETRFRLEGALDGARSEETVDALSGLQSVTANLRRTVMDLRLMPFETATRDLQRLARDTARAQDKRVALEVSGRSVELDRSVIDRLGAPLVHVVRNAVDHGIEPPAARESTGKPAEGTVEVRAERVRDGVVIEVEDDGRGIDADAVRQRVVDNDLLSAEEAAALPDEELYPYVFEAGFSTAEEVTDVSGRGVGMDVVDSVTSDLGGSVEVESTPGEGTTVRLRLPVTVAVAEVMFVQSGEERYGIPLTAVEEVESPTVRTDADGERHVVADGDEAVPLVRLAEALDTPGEHAADGVAVRLRPETRQAALHCDRVVETREVVIRPFEGALGEVPGVSGATLLGDGELVNIIDVATI